MAILDDGTQLPALMPATTYAHTNPWGGPFGLERQVQDPFGWQGPAQAQMSTPTADPVMQQQAMASAPVQLANQSTQVNQRPALGPLNMTPGQAAASSISTAAGGALMSSRGTYHLGQALLAERQDIIDAMREQEKARLRAEREAPMRELQLKSAQMQISQQEQEAALEQEYRENLPQMIESNPALAPYAGILEGMSRKEGTQLAAKLGMQETEFDFLRSMEALKREVAPGYDAKTEGQLRGEHNKKNAIKQFDEMEGAWTRIRQSSSGTPMSDIALIFNYMKLLDPASTVRESEFQTVAAAGGLPDRIQGIWERYKEGNALPEALRKDLLRQSAKLYTGAYERMQAARGRTNELVNMYEGVRPEAVIGSEREFLEVPAQFEGSSLSVTQELQKKYPGLQAIPPADPGDNM